jgi:hypothetical protein
MTPAIAPNRALKDYSIDQLLEFNRCLKGHCGATETLAAIRLEIAERSPECLELL